MIYSSLISLLVSNCIDSSLGTRCVIVILLCVSAVSLEQLMKNKSCRTPIQFYSIQTHLFSIQFQIHNWLSCTWSESAMTYWLFPIVTRKQKDVYNVKYIGVDQKRSCRNSLPISSCSIHSDQAQLANVLPAYVFESQADNAPRQKGDY